jgi:hypothetical protein
VTLCVRWQAAAQLGRLRATRSWRLGLRCKRACAAVPCAGFTPRPAAAATPPACLRTALLRHRGPRRPAAWERGNPRLPRRRAHEKGGPVDMAAVWVLPGRSTERLPAAGLGAMPSGKAVEAGVAVASSVLHVCLRVPTYTCTPPNGGPLSLRCAYLNALEGRTHQHR